MKYFKSFVVLCLCCYFLIPGRVYAYEATYYTYSANTCLKVWNNPNANEYIKSTVSGRAVFIRNGSTISFFVVSTSPGLWGSNNNNACEYATANLNQSGNYYYLTTTASYSEGIYSSDIPVFTRDYSIGDVTLNAIYYTYGEGAVDPLPPTPPPPAYGDLLDVKFSTSIAGGGSAAVNNIDHITWNPEIDSNGIAFDGTERVQIKAIAGNYTDSSRNGLLGLGVTDFDYNSGAEHMLAEYPATRGYYDVSWDHVIQQLNAGSISDFLNIRKNDDVWLKSGWIYQIRLVAGDYESQWITIYNGTSSGVENSLTIENSTELNMTLINTIQQINNMNNSVTNWEIDNTTINMENQDGTETTDKQWWAYLLEALVSLLNGILGFLGNLIGDLIDAIVSLFQPSEFTINNFNEYKLELKQNSGIFGQSLDFINTLKNTFTGVQYEDPVLHWSGISFGETVFIPAADYNLNDYVTMWGLGDFRTMAYLCSDGFIYFSLLVLIVRKLNEVLKK